MLEKYKEEQPIIYKILTSVIKNKKYSHAYLIDTNNYYDSQNLINALVKEILCSSKEKKDCTTCTICSQIENGNYPELKIINPEGLWIKKEKLKELQEEFSKKIVYGKHKIYIINGAEKLNKQSGNSLLKFLEEPAEGIIAILVTNNIENVLNTIVSRCQILKLARTKPKINEQNPIKKICIESNFGDISEEKIEKLEKAIEFMNNLETKKIEMMLNAAQEWHAHIKTKEETAEAFEIIKKYYNDLMQIKLNRNPEYFDKNEKTNKIVDRNTLLELVKKIDIINEISNQIKYNVNNNLLIDKLIIKFEGVE